MKLKTLKPEEYWTIDADFKKGKEEFKASFYGENGKKVSLKNNDDVQAILSKIDKKKDFDVTKVTKKNVGGNHSHHIRPRPCNRMLTVV